MKKKLFCLLIDDDQEDREFFSLSLKRVDPSIELDCASNGYDGLQLLKSYKNKLPDFIFLDLNMHLMNGKECLKEIKQIAPVADIPVIIYSTTLNEKIIYETLELGAFDHIEKPARLDELDKYLKRIFQIKETR